ncbi:hypothetical protein NXW94_30230 [Bacteroides ovatus]|nr:hypothetical protein [Bacteroides ovatus]
MANVWNWDEQWKVEWYGNGSEWEKCNATKDMILAAKAICSDLKKRLKYEMDSQFLPNIYFMLLPVIKMLK